MERDWDKLTYYGICCKGDIEWHKQQIKKIKVIQYIEDNILPKKGSS